MTLLPTLYRVTKLGATQTWQVGYEGNHFTTIYGKLDGKLQTQTTECFTTNEGRSNQRNPEQQAKFEAEALQTKQLRLGYSESIESPSTIQLPMKVKKYYGNEGKVIFPCTAQYKLNGVNTTARLINGNIVLFTRSGLVSPALPHLYHGLKRWMERLSTTALVGEVYCHGLHLQEITSLTKKPKEGSYQLKFYIFDAPEVKGNYRTRTAQLSPELFNNSVTPLPKYVCNSHEELERLHTKAIADGYEGLVINNDKGMYQYNYRSSDSMKMKKALDAEFKVVGYKLDKYGHPVYICTTSSDTTFNVKRKGTKEERLADAQVADSNIGKWLTVEYEMYSLTGTPLKPVGLNFRDCTENGEPLV